MHLTLWQRIFGLSLMFGLAACNAETPLDVKGTNITNVAEFKSASGGDRRLALNDHNGRAVTLASFKGKLVVLFFGYTHCPDVCPTTLSDMAQALKLLRPEEAGQDSGVICFG